MIQCDGIFVQGGGNLGPKYTYTGISKLVTQTLETETTWEILFLTSGIFTPEEDMNCDIFVAGAGGGAASGILGSKYGAGGGSGYVLNLSAVQLQRNQEYEVIVGAGGISINTPTATATPGGTSSITIEGITHSAEGGEAAKYLSNGKTQAGDGGSGGAGSNGTPGINGGDGTSSVPTYSIPGKGAGVSTRAYGDGNLYCTGGGCSETQDEVSENSGNGGWAHPSDATYTNGSDGIVSIRQHKEAS